MTERIKLNIERGYCESWTPRNGLRELVQNWWDAVRVSGSGGQRLDKVDVLHEPPSTFRAVADGTLRGEIRLDGDDMVLSNLGGLGRQALALGNTTKRRGDAYAGGHGEGLKVGSQLATYLLWHISYGKILVITPAATARA